jgi:hypothetical protein
VQVNTLSWVLQLTPILSIALEVRTGNSLINLIQQLNTRSLFGRSKFASITRCSKGSSIWHPSISMQQHIFCNTPCKLIKSSYLYLQLFHF